MADDVDVFVGCFGGRELGDEPGELVLGVAGDGVVVGPEGGVVVVVCVEGDYSQIGGRVFDGVGARVDDGVGVGDPGGPEGGEGVEDPLGGLGGRDGVRGEGVDRGGFVVADDGVDGIEEGGLVGVGVVDCIHIRIRCQGERRDCVR